MHPNRRRKKRPNYGLRTVEVVRRSNGFGFTISGQQPCILSCIVNNSPADQAGLRAGDFLISVNGVSVSKMAHDAVVGLIANCVDPITMTIAENYYSDSSDEDLEVGRMVNSRKPKYMHKPRVNRRFYGKGVTGDYSGKNFTKMKDNLLKSRLNCKALNDETVAHESLNISNPISMEDEAGPVEFKALIGYLGTIEMPKQLLPNSRLQTVCSCIRKLRQEKRTPTAVLMTILPTCLTLKNSSNHIIAIYPTNRVVYVGPTTDRESRYFGLVTSVVCDSSNDLIQNSRQIKVDPEADISNSCHVFVIDPKITGHLVHLDRADNFKISCTTDAISGSCLEFPQNALYIVNLIQSMYKLQNDVAGKNDLNIPIMANSPQPSASSNSDSGIGYRDDCGNISDRILVVEFPVHRPLPVVNINNRPQGFDGANLPLDVLDFSVNNMQPQFELNNISHLFNLNNVNKREGNGEVKQLNNLNNVRAYENIKNQLKPTVLLQKQNNIVFKDNNRLTCRAIVDSGINASPPSSFSSSNNVTKFGNVDSGEMYFECPVDVPVSETNLEAMSLQSSADVADLKNPVDINISAESSKSGAFESTKSIFRIPLEAKKGKKYSKMNKCENMDFPDRTNYHKLSPKVFGVSKTNYSCEELNTMDLYEEKFCYGSLQDLSNWPEQGQPKRNIAQSEPDVRIHTNSCDQNGGGVGGSKGGCGTEGPAAWATSFEKLLEDPVGLHAFAEFLKKEFSAENIYFWTACERYRRINATLERTTEAQRIFKQHLGSGASEAVNVDAQGRQAAEQGLSEAKTELFDASQKQIFNLMKFDSYPRFLKSQLYKQCLSGEMFVSSFDVRLALRNISQNTLSTPSKLKKSLSNAEDRRRKSLLPWNRKTSGSHHRSKSRDRSEILPTQKSWDGYLSVPSGDDNRRMVGMRSSDIHSSHSSLTSLDLAASQDANKQDSTTDTRTALCRVLLSNGSTTVVQIKDEESIQQLVNRLLEKRGLTYSSFEVFTNKHLKALDVTEPSSNLAGCEVTVEQRVIFKLDLPNRKIISVKSKYTKIIVDVLRPILHKYKFSLEEVKVTRVGYPVDVNLPVTTIDGARLNIELKDDVSCANPTVKISNVKISKLEEITNKVFEGILQEKSDGGTFKPPRSDKGSVKSEDWGSEHSSGLLGKFLRRDSAIYEKKKKSACPRVKANHENGEEVSSEINHKKPLIAKLKAGANKLHVGACSESDELVEGLTRAQRRLEDQRGTEINFELPDFLKDKDEDNSLQRPRQNNFESKTHFYLTNLECPSKVALTKSLKSSIPPNYENQSITALPRSPTSPSVSPLKNTVSQEKAVSQSKSPKGLDPPPLPPKPKIVPIKPPNWGHSGFYKAKEVPLEKHPEMFLEQPSSSFV